MNPVYPVSIEKLILTLFIALLYFSSVWWASGDIKKKGVRGRDLWNTLFIFTGPLGTLGYLLAGFTVSLQKKFTAPIPVVVEKKEKIRLFTHSGHLAYPAAGFFFWQKRKTRGFDAAEEIKEIIKKAAEERVTDIHLETGMEEIRSRLRIDGVLYDERRYPLREGKMLTSVVKVLAGIDVAEKKKSQDGSFSAEVFEKDIDFRVATSAAVHGESVAIRLLDRTQGLISLENLGVPEELISRVATFVNYPHGMILTSGPTGSGKTTTLYSFLQQINAQEKNIITIEDPIEYNLDGVTQIPVNPRAGVTFVGGLRSILRQDPDIIMVGEIRDEETLKIATQAALTGHLVFSTIHANDAVSTIIRLKDMGVEPYLISASVAAIISQQLVRRLCPQCKVPPTTLPDFLLRENVVAGGIYTAKGCRDCRGTGYYGRVGLFEVLELSEQIRKMIGQNADTEEIREVARQEGMITLKEDGLKKLSAGITSPEELQGAVKF